MLPDGIKMPLFANAQNSSGSPLHEINGSRLLIQDTTPGNPASFYYECDSDVAANGNPVHVHYPEIDAATNSPSADTLFVGFGDGGIFLAFPLVPGAPPVKCELFGKAMQMGNRLWMYSQSGQVHVGLGGFKVKIERT